MEIRHRSTCLPLSLTPLSPQLHCNSGRMDRFIAIDFQRDGCHGSNEQGANGTHQPLRASENSFTG